ncbi:MAG: ABC transporter permease [Betaproteobacteria bacterium]|nr:ABC transporter permease [Betaproteobacteria bacterium]
MLHFILWRTGRAIATVLLVLAGCFAAIRMAGSPVDILYPDGATPEQIVEMEREWGLDKSLPAQFAIYLGNLARGDFGVSIIERRPVTTVYAERLQPTLQLAGLALLLGTAVGVPLGALAALRRGRAEARAAMGIAFMGYAVPHFIIAILLILVSATTSTGCRAPARRRRPTTCFRPSRSRCPSSRPRPARCAARCSTSQRGFRAHRPRQGPAESRVIGLHVMRNAILPLSRC